MIGILTFQKTNNFGAALHTIALQRKIQELGYECQIINYQCNSVIKREYPYTNVLSPKSILQYLIYKRHLVAKFKTLQKEVKNYAIVSKEYSRSEIFKTNEEFSTFMIGSDVVWSLDITQNDYTYFLDFVSSNKCKLAFSASVGDCEKYRNDKQLPTLLRAFDSIAVRDEAAVEWVKSISGAESEYVCDPTMLYTAQEWDSIIKPNNYQKDYTLVYFPNQDMIEEAKEYAMSRNLRVVVINSGLPIKGVENVYPKSLKEFTGLIKHCRMLFTASYHGMLFALYYNRELRYYNCGLKARMASLASMLDIEKCNSELPVSEYTAIDYPSVNHRMQIFRERSLDTLRSMLALSK